MIDHDVSLVFSYSLSAIAEFFHQTCLSGCGAATRVAAMTDDCDAVSGCRWYKYTPPNDRPWQYILQHMWDNLGSLPAPLKSALSKKSH